MQRFSPSDAALEGFRITRENPGTVFAWSALYFVGILVIAVVMMLSLNHDVIALFKKDGFASQDAEQLGEMLAQSWPAFIVVLSLTVLLLSVIMGGIYRLVLRPSEVGFAHLRVGRDELRLVGVNFVLLAIGMGCFVADLLLAAIATNIAPILVVPVGLAGAAVTVWLGVRLSLATPMTFATHRFSIREAWRLTHGRFWPLFGMILLALIFYIIVWVLVTIIGMAVMLLGGGQQAVSDMSGPAAIVAFVLTVAIQLLLPVLQVILLYSPLAQAYHELEEHVSAPDGAATL